MKYRINFKKGFTLIELMVVIAIVSLLSSIILVSVKNVREKAFLNKTVAEMKSLQTSLELYKNQFGVYPGDSSGAWIKGNYDDDVYCWITCGLGYFQNDINIFFKSELVDKKLIPKVPNSYNYPKNCMNPYSDINNCYVLGYSIMESIYSGYSHRKQSELNSTHYFTCGRQRVQNYAIYLFANNKNINLPKLEFYDSNSNTYQDILSLLDLPLGNLYCISI